MNDSNPRKKKTMTMKMTLKLKLIVKIKKKKEAIQPSPPWMDLPEGIWKNILHRLGAIEILETARRVCATWRRVCNDPSMWRVIDMTSDRYPYYVPYDLEVMCRHAVDRSQGQLLDINMEWLVTDELLDYVAERSAKLRRLSISSCCSKVCEGWTEVFQKLPLLEELSLTHTSIKKEGIEALGRYCPLLKSFELNDSWFTDSDDDDSDDSDDDDEVEDGRNDEALAIAKNLPALCHLQLIGNGMTNKGLQAILNGCPHLVSLYLRRCFNVRLKEVSSSRYPLQIVDLKQLHDSLRLIPDDLKQPHATSNENAEGAVLQPMPRGEAGEVDPPRELARLRALQVEERAHNEEVRAHHEELMARMNANHEEQMTCINANHEEQMAYKMQCHEYQVAIVQWQYVCKIRDYTSRGMDISDIPQPPHDPFGPSQAYYPLPSYQPPPPQND